MGVMLQKLVLSRVGVFKVIPLFCTAHLFYAQQSTLLFCLSNFSLAICMKTVHMQTQINLMNELSTVPVIGKMPFF